MPWYCDTSILDSYDPTLSVFQPLIYDDHCYFTNPKNLGWIKPGQKKPWAEWSATKLQPSIWVMFGLHHAIHHCKIIALHFWGDCLAIRIFNSIQKYRTAEPPSPVSLNGRCQHVILGGEKNAMQLLGEHQVTGSCTEPARYINCVYRKP